MSLLFYILGASHFIYRCIKCCHDTVMSIQNMICSSFSFFRSYNVPTTPQGIFYLTYLPVFKWYSVTYSSILPVYWEIFEYLLSVCCVLEYFCECLLLSLPNLLQKDKMGLLAVFKIMLIFLSWNLNKACFTHTHISTHILCLHAAENLKKYLDFCKEIQVHKQILFLFIFLPVSNVTVISVHTTDMITLKYSIWMESNIQQWGTMVYFFFD